MNENNRIMNTAAFFTFLFAGIPLIGLHAGTNGNNFFSAAVCVLITILAVYIAAELYARMKRCRTRKCGGILTYSAAFILFTLMYCSHTAEFSETLPSIAREFEGGRFSGLFMLLSLILALYIGKRGIVSYSRLCVLFLPLILLPFVITAFVFIGYNADIVSLFPKMTFEPKAEYFIRGIALGAGIFALIFAAGNEKENESGKQIVGIGSAFAAFAACSAAEWIKYVLWFGADGLTFISHPIKTMLAQVPFINVQELFIVSYYVSYMLKISVFCICARMMAEKLFESLFSARKKRCPRNLAYITTAVLLFAAYLADKRYSIGIDKTLLSAICFCTLSIGMILREIASILSEKQKNDGNFPPSI